VTASCGAALKQQTQPCSGSSSKQALLALPQVAAAAAALLTCGGSPWSSFDLAAARRWPNQPNQPQAQQAAMTVRVLRHHKLQPLLERLMPLPT
jgi:hypothetical protein